MALVTTFATTPLTLVLFPPWYQKKLAAWKRGEIDWNEKSNGPEDTPGHESDSIPEKLQGSEIRKLLVALRLDSLPSVFTFVALLGKERVDAPVKVHPTKNGKNTTSEQAMSHQRPLEVHGLRMLELTDRLSSVMKESEKEDWSSRDPVVNAFHTFGQLNNVAVSGEVQLGPEASYADILNERASDRSSDMILLPWSETGSITEKVTSNVAEIAPSAFSNATYNHFVNYFFRNAPCSAAVFINNGFGVLSREEPRPLTRVHTNLSLRSNPLQATAPPMDRSHHIFFPYVGTLDDRVALRFVLRLAKNPNVTATILHVKGPNVPAEPIRGSNTDLSKGNSTVGTTAVQEFAYDQRDAFFTSMADSLSPELESRVVFNAVDSAHVLQDTVEHARAEVGLSPKNAGDLVVLGRGHRGSSHVSSEMGRGEIDQSLSETAKAMIMSNIKASILVVQAGGDVQ